MGMHNTLRPSRGAALILVVLALLAALVIATMIAQSSHPGSSLCGKQRALVAGGAYVMQNDEWNSSAPECLSYSQTATSFAVSQTSISQPASGGPGGYPSVSAGCFYGECTKDSGLPRQIANVGPGSVTSDWTTTQPPAGSYDAAYDIWFATSPDTRGFPDAAELMIWIAHQGSPRPLGYQVGTADVSGRPASVWYGSGSGGGVPTLTYELSAPVTSVSGLDVGAFIADAMDSGYLHPDWYLIDVQAGFELWQGGQGLATNDFSLRVR
jgi:hypothetical protein